MRQCDCSWRAHIWYTLVHPITVLHPWKILVHPGVHDSPGWQALLQGMAGVCQGWRFDKGAKNAWQKLKLLIYNSWNYINILRFIQPLTAKLHQQNSLPIALKLGELGQHYQVFWQTVVLGCKTKGRYCHRTKTLSCHTRTRPFDVLGKVKSESVLLCFSFQARGF